MVDAPPGTPDEVDTRIEALERQLAEARAERDRFSELYAREAHAHMVSREFAEAERDRLAADNARLREVLRPFAKIAEIEDSIGTKDGEGVKITVDLFRRAAAALAGKE